MSATETNQEDRFFKGLLVGVVVLALLALGVALWRQRQTTYRTDDTPEAAVYNYLLAIRRGDWDKAYDLLGDAPCKPRRGLFEIVLTSDRNFPDVQIVHSRQEGDAAWVTLRFRFEGSEWLPESGYRYDDQVRLKHTAEGWKLVYLPGPIWPFPPMGEGMCSDDFLGGD